MDSGSSTESAVLFSYGAQNPGNGACNEYLAGVEPKSAVRLLQSKRGCLRLEVMANATAASVPVCKVFEGYPDCDPGSAQPHIDLANPSLTHVV
eukprot:2101980-Prymnesium_polylepis.1